MSTYVKKHLFQGGMKQNAVQFIVKCLECQQVKAKYHHPIGLLRLHDIPMLKQEFIVGFPPTPHLRHNSIFIIVDKPTKSADFILTRETNDAIDLLPVIINEIICLHWFPKKIILDRDSWFMSRSWTTLLSTLGTQLNLSTTYHP